MSNHTRRAGQFAGAALLFSLVLAGCATPTPEERAARVQKDVEYMIAVYGPACAKLGFAPESDPWRDCILRLNSRDAMVYATRPLTTSCIGHRGFFSCTSF